VLTNVQVYACNVCVWRNNKCIFVAMKCVTRVNMEYLPVTPTHFTLPSSRALARAGSVSLQMMSNEGANSGSCTCGEVTVQWRCVWADT